MNIKTIILMIFQIAMISAYMPNHEYNMLEKRKSLKTHLQIIKQLITSSAFKSAPIGIMRSDHQGH